MSNRDDRTALFGYLALGTTTLIWGFSFTLIGNVLKGLDSTLIASLRLGLACLCFLPFLRPGRLPKSGVGILMGIGALQFGCMYVAYMKAFSYAPVPMVILFSSFTPIWIALIGQFLKPLNPILLVTAGVLATSGAIHIRYSGQNFDQDEIWIAFGLMQISNICFGGGQLAYRSWKLKHPDQREQDSFAWLYLGGFLLSMAFVFYRLYIQEPPLEMPDVTTKQLAVIVYLGIVASGGGFFLWNFGSSRVSTGTLAAANNLLVPLGVLISIGWSLWKGDDITSQQNWLIFAFGAGCIFLALFLIPKDSSNSQTDVES